MTWLSWLGLGVVVLGLVSYLVGAWMQSLPRH